MNGTPIAISHRAGENRKRCGSTENQGVFMDRHEAWSPCLLTGIGPKSYEVGIEEKECTATTRRARRGEKIIVLRSARCVVAVHSSGPSEEPAKT